MQFCINLLSALKNGVCLISDRLRYRPRRNRLRVRSSSSKISVIIFQYGKKTNKIFCAQLLICFILKKEQCFLLFLVDCPLRSDQTNFSGLFILFRGHNLMLIRMIFRKHRLLFELSQNMLKIR